MNWTLETMREICIDLLIADANKYRISNAHVALMIRAVLNLPIDGKWGEYFEQVSAKEFDHPPLLQALLTFGAIPSVTKVEEVIKQSNRET